MKTKKKTKPCKVAGCVEVAAAPPCPYCKGALCEDHVMVGEKCCAGPPVEAPPTTPLIEQIGGSTASW